MRKWLIILLITLVTVPIMLEIVFRVSVPMLPPALQLAAQRVEQGESLDINRIGLMNRDIDHNFMMKTNVEDALYGSHQSVVFHVDTVQILDSRMGFRTYPVEQGDDIDVTVVGDSFSFCFTEFEDCWVTQFEADTGLRTMNLGTGSTGSMSHWRFVDTFGEAFKSPLVIWQFFINDFNEDYQLAVLREEIPESDVTTEIPDYDDNSNPIVQWLRQNSIAWVVMETALFGEEAYISDFERYHFTRPYSVSYTDESGQTHTLNFGQNYELIASNMDDPRVSSGVPMTREALENARDTIADWGGEFVVFLVPTREEVYAHLTAPIMGEDAIEQLGDPRREMLSLCEELDLTCLDMLPIFQEYAQRGEHLYYTDDMHLNPNGNTILADELEQWLTEQGYIEASSNNE